MRKHAVNCQIENEKRLEYIQDEINESSVLYIKERIDGSKLTKEEKLMIIDTLITNIKAARR